MRVRTRKLIGRACLPDHAEWCMWSLHHGDGAAPSDGQQRPCHMPSSSSPACVAAPGRCRSCAGCRDQIPRLSALRRVNSTKAVPHGRDAEPARRRSECAEITVSEMRGSAVRCWACSGNNTPGRVVTAVSKPTVRDRELARTSRLPASPIGNERCRGRLPISGAISSALSAISACARSSESFASITWFTVCAPIVTRRVASSAISSHVVADLPAAWSSTPACGEWQCLAHTILIRRGLHRFNRFLRRLPLAGVRVEMISLSPSASRNKPVALEITC